jgi:hypothetical protein
MIKMFKYNVRSAFVGVCCAAVMMCVDVSGMIDFSGVFEPDECFHSSGDCNPGNLKSLQEKTESEKEELLGKLDSVYSVLATAGNSDVTDIQLCAIEKLWNDFSWHVFQEKCLQQKIHGYYNGFSFCKHPKIEPFGTYCRRLLGILKSGVKKNGYESTALEDLIMAFLIVFDLGGLNKLKKTGFNWSEYELEL